MSNIIGLIGGTGAKVMESVIHLAACGLYGDRSLEIFFIDLEDNNGNHNASEKSFNYYNNSKTMLNICNSNIFSSKISRFSPDLWNPINDRTNTTLDEYFSRASMSKENAMFYDAMFSAAERNFKLDKGCLGRQHIGAVIMASKMDLTNMEPWKTVWGRIEQAMGGDNPQGVKVFLAGSVFGGTGAPGISTVPLVIYQQVLDKYEKDTAKIRMLSIGGFMALPYFTFDDFDSNKGLTAKAKNFLHKTRQALMYYSQTQIGNRYDSVYLAGNEEQAKVRKVAVGGPEQRNDPHFIELFGAIALVDFLNHQKPAKTQYNISATEKKGVIGWDDLPLQPTEKNLIKKMARFAFVYSGMYRPVLAHIGKKKIAEREVPWYKEFFLKKGLKAGEKELELALDSLDKYTRDFLLWMAFLHTNGKKSTQGQVELLNYQFFAREVSSEGKNELELLPNFDLARFQELVCGEKYQTPIHKLWDCMCEKKGYDTASVGVGSFISALYECME